MKKVPTIVCLLLMNGGLSQGMAIKHQSISRISSEGIFDRAMRKIEKEENDKAEAKEYMQRQAEEDAQMQKRKSLYEKNYQRAELQASQMLKSAQDEAKITASAELSDMFGLNSAFDEKNKVQQVEPEQEQEQKGFLGSFNTRMNTIKKQPNTSDDEQQSIQQKNQAIIDLNTAIQDQVAPNLVNSAVNEALGIKEQQLPKSQRGMDQTALQRMKNKMNQKLNQRKVVQQAPQPAQAPAESMEDPQSLDQSAEPGSDLAAFNKLPLNKVSPATEKKLQEDSVSSFLRQADEQEQAAQRKLEDDEKQRAFEQSVMFGQQEPQDTDQILSDAAAPQQPKRKPVVEDPDVMPEDNPISAMYALKHPEQQQEIENMSTEEMAQSHYNSISSRASNPY